MEAEREDGELSDSDSNACDDVNVYNPVLRPNSNTSHPRNVRQSIPSSDNESYSSDSDSDSMCHPKKQKISCSQMEIDRNGSTENNKARKKNNIWANVLQEDELTLEIGGVGLKKLKGDRNVESYDYEQALKLHQKEDDNIFDDIEETEENTQKRLNRKRRFYDNSEEMKRQKKLSKPRHLTDIKIELDWDSEQLGGAIADALFEQKPELIVKVVEVLGHEKALDLYTKTQEVEKEGGMMILNGSRRRTSGGVYLQVLKTMGGVEKELLAQIFCEDTKETQMWRKRKRVNRKRVKHKSGGGGEKSEEDGMHLKGLFSDDPGGTKCPGSTPVTSPTGSDNEEGEVGEGGGGVLSPKSKIKGNTSLLLPLQEVCEKVASSLRDRLTEEDESSSKHEEMETC